MIAYLQGKDVTVEVPDDIGEKELGDIQNNFDQYVEPEADEGSAPVATPTPTATAEPTAPTPTDTAAPKRERWVPNFYESFIKPSLPAMGPMGAVVDLLHNTPEITATVAEATPDVLKGDLAKQAVLTAIPPSMFVLTPEGRAFAGKAIEGYTFGLSKPLLDPVLEKEYKDHPVFGATGEVAGAVGSLLTTGGALKVLGLGAKATAAGVKGVQLGWAAGSRFIPPAIMTGATFGTQTFIKKTVKALQDGEVDLVDFGGSVIRDTSLGTLLGGISGIANAYAAVSSAAGLGFISSKMDGADNAEAGLNAAIWALFETVGSFGREARLRKDALNTLSDSIGEYVKVKKPDISPEMAKGIGDAVVAKAAQRVGGIDAVVKSQENALQIIEDINQQVRQGKVRMPEPPPVELPKLTGPATSAPAAAPTAPPLPPVEPVRPNKPVKYDAQGIPVRRPGSVVSIVNVGPDLPPVKVTHKMILDEAEGLLADAKEQRQVSELENFVLSNGGLKSYRPDETGKTVEAEEMRDVPVRFKSKQGLAVDEMAQMAYDQGLIAEPNGDLLRNELKNLPKRGAEPVLADFYDQAHRNLEEFFGSLEGAGQTAAEPRASYGTFLDRQRANEGMQAAIRDPKTGELYTGPSHSEILAQAFKTDGAVANRLSDELLSQTENVGFADENFEFVSRKVAERRFGILNSDSLRTAAEKRAIYGQLGNTNALVNPTPQEAAGLFKRAKALDLAHPDDKGVRWFVDPNGDLYMWDAADMEHDEVMSDVGAPITEGHSETKGVAYDLESAKGVAGRLRKQAGSFKAAQPAYHGSPYSFERFDIQKIGTGEGHQAFGWGLYFAGKKDVAEYYKRALAAQAGDWQVNGKTIKIPLWHDLQPTPEQYAVKAMHSLDHPLDVLRKVANGLPSTTAPEMNNAEAAKGALELIESGQLKRERVQGHTYEVDIPEDNEFLDYDKILADQSKSVRKIIDGVAKELGLKIDPYVTTGDRFYNDVSYEFSQPADRLKPGLLAFAEQFYAGPPVNKADMLASRYLAAKGIPGIKYLDRLSRGAGEGSSNYVIFDDSRVKVLSVADPSTNPYQQEFDFNKPPEPEAPKGKVPSETVKGGFKAIEKPHLEVEFKKDGAVIIPNRTIDSPADLAYAFKFLHNEAQENFFLGAIKDGRIVAVEHLAFGTIDQVAVYPYETINLIDAKEADGFFIVHNHPSGEVVPSPEDKNLTNAIKDVLESQGAEFRGHVIIDDTKFGFIDPDGKVSEQTHQEYAETKEAPKLKKYFNWLKSKSDVGPAVTSPQAAFELFKGIQKGKDEAIVYLLDIQNRLLNAIVVPQNQIAQSTIQKLAASYRAAGVITVNSGLTDREIKDLSEKLRPTNIRFQDDIAVAGESYRSARENLSSFEPGARYGAGENAPEMFGGEREDLGTRYDRLRKQALEQGMTPAQASKWAKEQMRAKPEPSTGETAPKQTEFGAAGGVEGFGQGREGEQELFNEAVYPSSKTPNRQFGEPGDEIAAIKRKIGGLEFIKKMRGPELVKLAKSISGKVPVIKQIMKSLGYFKPGTEEIALRADLFKDQQLWEAVLAHEVGHLMDFKPDDTMARGNILGRIASLKHYQQTLLPESPESTEKILTDEDRRRFQAEAERIAKGESSKGPDREFEPQAILDVWNAITGDIDPDLHDYIKGLDVEQKKSLIKGAMQALKKGEKITVTDINKFNKDAGTNFKRVADIYADLLKKEIRKRKLWENEVLTDELKALSQYWKPFDVGRSRSFTAYRFSAPELYADFVSVLLNAPAKAKQIAPSAYEAYFNYLQQKPEVMKNLIELQSLIQADDADLQKVRGADILEMFEKGEQAFRARQADLEASKKSIWDKLRILFWDKNAILLDERDKLAKRETLPPETDARYAIEKNSVMGSFVKSYLEDFDRLVYAPARNENLLSEVKTILFLDRIGDDRSELANPLGHTPETAQQFLAHMRETEPEKFARASELAEAARDWFRQVSDIPGAEDFFSPEQRTLMAQSKKYAPFRVVDYMRDYMSAGMAQQIGTFKDIGDPLTSLGMKGVSVLMAVERNRLKKIVGEMLLKAGTFMRPAKVTTAPGMFHIEEPKERHLGVLSWKDNGKWVAFHTDRDIADTFNSGTHSNMGALAGVLNTILKNNVFRGLFITFNFTFQSANLIKDFMRAWKNTPGLTVWKALRLYLDSIPEAKARAKGLYDPLIQEMERAGAIQLSLNDLILGETSDDQELAALLERYDLVEGRQSKYKDIPVLKQITSIMDFIRYTGDTVENIPKIVGWKALDDMSDEERAYFVRNLIGTPNWRRKGAATPLTNTVFMFSNIFKEGYRGLWEAGFTNKRTRGAYWLKTFETTILPKLAMALAAAGFFGAAVKRVMDKASDYHKTNYVVIPLGVDESDNGVYLTIPQDEDARFLGGIFWKMITRSGDPKKAITEILSFGDEQFPSLSPMFSLAQAWQAYLTGNTPKDRFRGQDILTDQEKAAGGMYAFEPMIRWTLNQTGLVRLDVRDKLKNEPVYKTVLAGTPILQRFLRIGRTGERELVTEAVEPVKRQQAREAIDLKDRARQAIRDGKNEIEFAREATTVDEAKQMRQIYKNLKKGFTDDPYIQALNRAGSKEEKIAILKEARQLYKTGADFNEYLDTLYMNKIIPARVALEARD